MDPNALVERLYLMVVEEDRDGIVAEEVLETLDDLKCWLNKGGFALDADHCWKLADVAQYIVREFWV
jgi:O-succinylbenzoate synthase